MKKIVVLFILLVGSIAYAQTKEKKSSNGKDLFDKVYNSYSGKKLSTVILKDGRKIEGYKKDVDRKKGQIYYIKIKDKTTGKKLKFNSDEIKEMYLYPGGVEKFGKMLRHLKDVRQWERSDLDNDIIRQGYIYFKNQEVSLKNKKKKKEYLMQIVNPTFSKYIEVYGDPVAKQTTSIGFAGFSLAGGLAKSYYAKKGDKIFWLRKKDLKKEYDNLFGDCEEFKAKYPKDSIKWRHLSEYILEYTKMMSKK